MGRNAAGESFLQGYLKHARFNELWVQVERLEYAREFARVAREHHRSEPIKAVDKNNLQALANPGVAYYPGPGIGNNAWQRAYFGHNAWSCCGITHTTSSARAMDAISELMVAPVQPWDALICTSKTVKKNVEAILMAQEIYLKDRLGVTKIPLPQLPVIPLGINTEKFIFSAQQKWAARASLGVSTDALVVLYMGRLSFHAKAHPLAMYQALESAAGKSGKKIVLIECGWHANGSIEKAYIEAAKFACPSVRVVSLDGRDPEQRATAWASADVFCSLSDNIQETFGIVPIEAMAAGLPVVVSDWDGYKDTVRHGVDGFRIPTIMPQPGYGVDLAIRHALDIDTYDMYCGHTASLIAVDVEAATDAFVQLFQSESLRIQFGEAGRKRAKEQYDWSLIVPQYESLWAQLNEIRKSKGVSATKLQHPWPARLDPFSAFVDYPTRALGHETVIGIVDQNLDASFKRAKEACQLMMVNYANYVLPSEDDINYLLGVATIPKPVVELIAEIPVEKRHSMVQSILLLVKLGLLKVYT